MRQRILAAVTATALLAAAPSAGAQASDRAGCIGIAASSFAGMPGALAAITHVLRQQYKAAGVAPGQFEAELARVHAGDFEACFLLLPQP